MPTLREDITNSISTELEVDPHHTPSPRILWAENRARMERTRIKFHPRQKKKDRHWKYFNKSLEIFGTLLKFTGLDKIGRKNALDVKLRHLELSFSDLPSIFDGYSLLHISDPHFDCMPDITKAILKVLPQEKVNLVIFTGDYRNSNAGPFEQIVDPLKSIMNKVQSRDGFVAVLGNHDSWEMVPTLEKLGLRVLINETLTLERPEGEIHLTGLDDVFYFYTKAARDALEDSPKGFKIALVHSNEMGQEAADNGYHLYLCGHSHGGQICLPTGIPILNHTDMKRSMISGRWKIGNMEGYTNTGVGSVKIPIRFFCPPEIVHITLRTLPKK